MTKVNPRDGKTWPAYILGGRIRTSTVMLLIAFVGLGWMYHNWEPPARVPQQVPASEVVPPGFIPDPAYTWAPRTNFQRPPTTTPTSTTPTTTESASPTTKPGEEPHGPTSSGEPTTPAGPPSPQVTTPVPSGTPPAPSGPPPGPPPPAPPPGA